MDLKGFGETLTSLMTAAKLTRPALAEKMYVTVSLIDKWKSVSEDERQHRRPSHDQVVQLIQIFTSQLDPEAAQQWALQADHHISKSDLTHIFPSPSLHPAPLPDPVRTLTRLQPSSTHRLFGIQSATEKILQALNQEDDYWILAVSGIGGIGKTSLAYDLANTLCPTPRFRDIVWISAKQEEFFPHKGLHLTHRPALDSVSLIDNILTQLDSTLSIARPSQEKQAILMHWFKTYPYLVVVDNLETIEDYESLLPPIRKLANPTKFLLTSRYSLGQHSDVFSHSLTGLSQADTFAFLKYQAKTLHIDPLHEATAHDLEKIYQIVGGNPLALKLVVGQIRFSNLPYVLKQLQTAKGKKVSELYRFIYRQIWNSLDEPTRQVLLITPLAPNGTFQDLQRLSKVSEDELHQALEQLVNRSLVAVRDDPNNLRYYIHNLTKQFLRTEIFNRWKPN